MNKVQQETVGNSLDNIAKMWVNILLAHILSKKEQEKQAKEKGVKNEK